ncbi:MAG: hypothetical protein OXM55_03800 [Bdellovibrionales bacterium]|nr:hypothetical protein [Bdellovibrionales bacterium]
MLNQKIAFLHTKYNLVIALLFPILTLAGLALFKSYELKTNQTRVFPIKWSHIQSDSLQGSFLQFSINYGIKCVSLEKTSRCPFKAHICLEPYKRIGLHHKPDKNCTLFIKGICECGLLVFLGGEGHSHRYYIPEKHFNKMSKLFKNKNIKKEVLLSITKTGVPIVKDILIEGQSIKKKMK